MLYQEFSIVRNPDRRKNHDAQKTLDALFVALDGTGVVGANPAQRWRTDAAGAPQPAKARVLDTEFADPS
jgi:hypothetical protein